MRVLFDVSHPAHVHLFRHAIGELEDRGHSVAVTSREKDVTTALLDAFGIRHRCISRKRSHPAALPLEWGIREARLLAFARRFDPDVVVSRLNPPAAHVAFLLGARCLVFDDSEPTRLASRLTHPFADEICTPAGYGASLGPKQTTYRGFHELAYLHPARFDPDPDLLASHGVEVTDPYFVLRFVSWSAHHDVGRSGMGRETKRELVSLLADRGTVYISSEDPLPPAFEDYRLPIPPHVVHHLLAFADAYVGDSQTMATEAAVLGTPSVRSNSFVGDDDMTNFVELEEEYGLLRSVSTDAALLETVRTILEDPSTATRWQERRERLLAEKVDVTDVILDRILAGTSGVREEAPDPGADRRPTRTGEATDTTTAR